VSLAERGEALAEVRSYARTGEEAAAVVALEADAFGAGTYSPAGHVAEILSLPGQRLWLARARRDGRYVGFLSAFETFSLRCTRLEVDLLAVSPDFRQHGVGTLLVRTALEAWRCSRTDEARALVRVGNVPSERAFLRAGFQPMPASLELFSAPALWTAGSAERCQVRPGLPADLTQVAAAWPELLPDMRRAEIAMARPDVGLFVVSAGRHLLGFVELLEVHTVAYDGVWIESIRAHMDDPDLLGLLLKAAGEWARARRLGPLGALIELRREGMRGALGRLPFQPVGHYRYFCARR
jgi:ribosomal protein S18 acetylase RimI-like enzyme